MRKEYLSRSQLRALFTANGIWAGLTQGSYTCAPQDKVRIPVKEGHSPPGGVQLYHKWRDLFGRHAVTTHCVLDAEGWPVHWDEKDLILGETKYIHRKELDT